jgi:dihydrofolate reductase
VSLDGRVAASSDAPPNQEKFGGWTSEDDKRVFRVNVAWADLLVMGSKTLAQSPMLAKMDKQVVIISRSSPVTPPMKWRRIVVRPDRASLTGWLKAMDGKKLLLCGGVMTYGTFLQFGLVDELSVTVEPIVLNTGPSFAFNGLVNVEAEPQKFELVRLDRLNKRQTLHIHYKRAL